MNDAMWIADLLAHGRIRGSFVPPTSIQELRELTHFFNLRTQSEQSSGCPDSLVSAAVDINRTTVAAASRNMVLPFPSFRELYDDSGGLGRFDHSRSIARRSRSRQVEGGPVARAGELLFKYVSPDGVRKFLATARLRYSSPLSFNDPYDIQHDFQFPFSRDELQVRLRARLIEMAEAGIQPERVDGVPIQTIGALRELHERGEIEARDRLADESTRAGLVAFDELVAEHNRRWHEYAAGFRILALSREPNHPLMWAHYARGHQGAVLRFRPVARSESEIDRAVPVEYSDDVPYASNLEQFVNRLTGLPDYQDPDVFRRYLLTKATCWSYENEYRVLKRAEHGAGEYNLVGIRGEELEGVVLGNRMSDADREAVRGLMRERWPTARVYHAVKVRGRFQLDVTELA